MKASVEIIDEGERHIIINKPQGIHSHPLKYSEKDNCLSFLRRNNFSDL